MKRSSGIVAVVLVLPLVSRSGVVAQDLGIDLCEVFAWKQCLPDTLEIVFPEGDDLTKSVYEYGNFVPGMPIEVVVVTETQTERIQGFSYAVRHDAHYLGITDDAVTTDGTTVADLMRNTSGFDVTRTVEGGWISAVALSFATLVELPPGRNTLARATYSLEVEPPSQGTMIEFTNLELNVPNSPPVEIDFAVWGVSSVPGTVVHGWIHSGGGGGKAVGGQITGDCNQDGRIDIGDAICILNVKFGRDSGTEDAIVEFPCGDGTAQDPSNRRLLDFNEDWSDEVDISDGIAIINYLFAAGPGPLFRTACIPVPGCPQGPACP